MLVRNILSSKPNPGSVITVGPDAKVAEAAQILSEKRIGTIVISKDGVTPLGILSERDIVRDLGKRGSICLEDKVDALMTKTLVTCSLDMPVVKVLGEMTRGRFRHMPVMEGDQMVGLISLGDVVKARLDDLLLEKEALEEMIMGKW